MTPEEIDKILTRLERLSTKNEKTWEKLDTLAALASAHADRQILVLNRIEKNTDSNNRVADELGYTRRKLSEMYEQREYIRAGLDAVRSDLKTHFAIVTSKVDDVDRDIDLIRSESSGRFALLTPEDIRADAAQRGEAIKTEANAKAEAIRTTAEAEAKAAERDPWFSRILVVVFRGGGGAQVTAILLAIVAALALIFGGATLKQMFWPNSSTPAALPAPAAAKAAEKGATDVDIH